MAFFPVENIWPHLFATSLPRYLSNSLIIMSTVAIISCVVGNNRFYIAGWVANEQCNTPQKLPESMKGDPVGEKQHEDYLKGYGDSFAHGECLTADYEAFYS